MSVLSHITYRKIWTIAYPVIIGSIAQNLIVITDTAFLARVSETALGAAAIGGMFYMALVMIGAGLGLGTQIIIARRFGERKYAQTGTVLRHSAILALAISATLFVAYFLWGKALLTAFMHSAGVLNASVEFLNYRMFGIFFAFFNYLFNAFYVGIARTAILSRATVLIAVVNIILDYLLVFGKFGFPQMGVGGAALASTIAELCGMLYFLYFSFTPANYAKYRIWKFEKLSLESMRNLLLVSAPLMMQYMLSFFTWFIFFLMIERMGERPLAVSNIIRSIYQILLLPTWGFASAASSQVSYVIGCGEKESVMPLTLRIAKLALLAVMPLILLMLLLGHYVMLLYTNDVSLINDCMAVLPVIAAASLLLAPAFIFFSAISGTGSTQISFANEMVVISFYLLFTFIIVRQPWVSTPIVWIAEIVYSTMMGTLAFSYLRFGGWRKRRI
jgi:putative MATE family efflux protein